MGKRLFFAVAVAGMVLAMAGPASAKGPLWHGAVSVSGTVKVEGPKQDIPIVLGWRGDCGLLFPCDDLAYLDSDFLALARDTGLTGSIPSYAKSYYLRPARSKLGPAYRVTWRLAADNGDRAVVEQTLYPFAPERPWVYTVPGQKFFDLTLEGGWISAPPSTAGLLQGYGLPPRAPGAGAAVAAIRQAPSSHVWIWFLAAGVLLVLLVAGSVAGRRRAAIRAA